MTLAFHARTICAALLSTALTGTAHAALVTVTTLADSGAGSLRQAVASANAGDTIQFAAGLSGAIAFGTPLALGRDVSILGNGAIALDGNDATLVLQITGGARVALDGLTIQHGNNVIGGGVYSAGYLTLTHCILRDNHATYGGALFVDNLPGAGYAIADSFVIDNEVSGPGGGIYDAGQLASSITRTGISGNISSIVGGGIAVASAHALRVDHSTIAGNQALSTSPPSKGGGMAIEGGASVDILDSTVAANKAYFGGGIVVDSAASVQLTASLVDGNTAQGYGGGVFVFGASLSALDATIADNLAYAGAGGAIALQNSNAQTASVALSSSTLAFNQAGTNGGGISVLSGVVSLHYTLIGANTAPTNPDVQAVVASLGFNLVQTRGTSFGYALSDLAGGSDPKLNTLAFNGGPTDTLSLQAGSAAIGAIPAANCASIPLDQRGFRRVGGNCDIGAFETGAIADTIFAAGFE